MRKINFIHISDIHFDTPFVGFSQYNKSDIRRNDIRKTFKNIIDICIKKEIDYLFISGDLYEDEYINLYTLNYINNFFKKIDKVKIIIISGNHDPYTIDSQYRKYLWNSNVNILSTENVEYVDDTVSIQGMGFKNFREAEYDISNTRIKDTERINIFLMHGTVDERLSNENYNLIPIEELDNINMDYIGVGHYHKFFGGLGEKSNIFNPGSPEPLGFDEACEHGIIYGEITKDDNTNSILKTEFIKTGEKEYILESIDIEKINNDDDIITYINNIDNKEDKICRFILIGYLKVKGYTPDLEYIEDQISKDYFYAKVIDNTTIDYDFEMLSKSDGIMGVFTDRVLKLILQETDDEMKNKYRLALYYGLEALEGDIKIKSSRRIYEDR